MSHLLPIAPIKTYLCKQELWPNDCSGGLVTVSKLPPRRAEAWDAKPQRSIVPSQAAGSAQTGSPRLQRSLGGKNIKHIYAETSRMHSFTEVKVNRALLDFNLRGLLHTSTSGGLPWRQYQKAQKAAIAVTSQEGKFHSKKRSGQFLVFS